jgi:hypothetical protein
MANRSVPLVDEQNPLYCPDFSASAYLHSLRRLHSTAGWRGQKLVHSFAKILGRAFSDDRNDFLTRQCYPSLDESSRSSSFSSSFDSSCDPYYHLLSPPHAFKRKQPTSFSDLQGPAKRTRSFLTTGSDTPFVVTEEGNRLCFSPFTHNSAEKDCGSEKQAKERRRLDEPDSSDDLTTRVQELEGKSSYVLQISLGSSSTSL